MSGKTSTSTQGIAIPPEVLQRYNSVNATAENAAATPFQAYSSDPNAFVAPLSPTQQAGIANTNNYGNEAQPYYGAATAYTLGGAQAVDPTGLNTGAYFSPFLSNVVGNTLATQQFQNQQQDQQLKSQNIQQNAFGSDRSGVANANLAFAQNTANNKEIADLLQSGFTQAQGVAQQQQGVGLGAAQANRAALQQTGQQLAGLGTGAQSAALQGATAQLQAGQNEQTTQQAGLSALYNQFLQQQGYPFQTAQFLANIAEGTGALSGSTTTTTQPSPFFSDERLKDDIEDIGRTHDGMRIVKFRYKGKPEKQIGFLAQDVEKHHPEAVGLARGYKTVDYDGATRQAAGLGRARRYASGGMVDDGGFGPAAAQGLGAMPHAQVRGYVPGASLPVGKLMTPGSLPKAPASTLSQIMDTGKQVQDLKGLSDTAGGAFEWGKSKLAPPEGLGGGAYTNPMQQARGGLVAHYASGGVANDDNPYNDTQPGPGLNIPNERPENLSLQKPGQLQKPQSAFGDIMNAAKLASSFMPFRDGGRVGMFLGGDPPDVDENGNPKTGLGAIQQAVKTPDDPEYGTGLGTLRAREGFRPQAYPDRSPGNPTKPRVGYGSDTWTDQDGTPHQVDASTVVNKAGAERDLQRRVQQTRSAARGLVSPDLWDSMPPGMTESLTDLAYNSGGLQKYPGLLGAIQRGDPDEIANEMARRGEDNGGVNRGRRGLDANLIDNGTRPTGGGALLAYAPKEQQGLGAGRETSNDVTGSTPAAAPAKSGLGQVMSDTGGWFKDNKDWLIPVAKGLATMASSNSRYLGSALLQGLGGGAQAYQDQLNTNIQNAQREEQTRNIGEEANVRHASLYEKVYIQGKGYYLYDKSKPYVPIKQLTDSQLRPIGNVNPDSYPTRPGSAPPSAPSAPTPPAVAGSQQAPNDPSALAFKATTKVPQDYAPPNQLDATLPAGAAEQNRGMYGPQVVRENEQANHAQQQLLILQQMEQQYNNLNPSDFVGTGAGAANRAAIASKFNTMWQIATGNDKATPMDPSKIASVEELNKNTFRLGSQLAQQLGHEPGYIVQQAIGANPNIENTKQGFARIVAGMKEANQYQQDHAAFIQDYYTRFGNLSDAEAMFQKLNPTQQYADRAILSTVSPTDLKNFRDYVGTYKDPAAIKHAQEEIDSRYGKGVGKLLMGGH